METIIQELKIANSSIIVGSTLDATKVDQLTVVVRYISSDSSPVEGFIGFLPSVGYKGQEMNIEILNMFEILEIDIKNCRGQSFDNANNISGIQARIKRKSKTAEFIPCFAHS